MTCSAAHTRLGKNIGNAPAPRVFLIGQESVGVLVRLFMAAGFTCEEMVLRPAFNVGLTRHVQSWTFDSASFI